jgi:hypothetical protein
LLNESSNNDLLHRNILLGLVGLVSTFRSPFQSVYYNIPPGLRDILISPYLLLQQFMIVTAL